MLSYCTAMDFGLQPFDTEPNVVKDAASRTGSTVGEVSEDHKPKRHVETTSTADNVKIAADLAKAEESLINPVESLNVALTAMQERELELIAREEELAKREAVLEHKEAAMQRRERATARNELTLDQQRVLHAEEVAALGVRAGNVRREQSTVAAARAELQLAQRNLCEAQAAMQIREQALAEQRGRLIDEEFALNELAAEIPAAVENAKAEAIALQSHLGIAQQELGEEMTTEMESVQRQRQEMQRLCQDGRARAGSQGPQGGNHMQGNGKQVSSTDGLSTAKPLRLSQPTLADMDEASTIALNSPSLSSPASPWASEGPSMNYGLQLLEARLQQQDHGGNAVVGTLQDGQFLPAGVCAKHLLCLHQTTRALRR